MTGTDVYTAAIQFLGDHATPIVVVAAGLLVLVGLAVAARRVRPDRLLAWIAAAIATGVSGTGMWVVADKALHLGGPLRGVLFGFAEIGLLSSAIRARRHHRAHGRGGPDAAAVWVIAAAAGAVSAMESSSVPEVMVRLCAPLLAAWLWHRGLDDTDGTSRAREAITMRLSIRRLLVALRLAEPGTVGLADVDRTRRLNAIVLAALRHEDSTGRARARAARRLERAGRRARGNLDPAGIGHVRTMLAAVYGMRHGVSRAALADLTPWQPASPPREVDEDRDEDQGVAGEPTPDPWRYSQPVTTAAKPTTRRRGRSDDELLAQLADLTPGASGQLSIRTVRQALGVNQDRARRLLALAGRQPDGPAPVVPVPVRINGVPVPAAFAGDNDG